MTHILSILWVRVCHRHCSIIIGRCRCIVIDNMPFHTCYMIFKVAPWINQTRWSGSSGRSNRDIISIDNTTRRFNRMSSSSRRGWWWCIKLNFTTDRIKFSRQSRLPHDIFCVAWCWGTHVTVICIRGIRTEISAWWSVVLLPQTEIKYFFISIQPGWLSSNNSNSK